MSNEPEDEADVAPVLDVDPAADALIEIVQRTYSASSDDGLVSAVVGGDLRLKSVTLGQDYGVTATALTKAVNRAVGAALKTATTETIAAIQQSEGIDPELRKLLGAHR